MTPLSDALTAAQRSALAALEKAYVASLGVLREWGVTAPNMTERVTEAKVEPASDKQWTLVRKLAQEKGTEPPDTSLTKAQASQVIDELQAGTYNEATGSDPERTEA